jgi:hypothetical protein
MLYDMAKLQIYKALDVEEKINPAPLKKVPENVQKAAIFQNLEVGHNDNLYKDLEPKGLEIFTGVCGCFLILFLLVFPICSIVFSRLFPWQEDGSVCDLKKFETVINATGSSSSQPVQCTCREDFPTYMLVTGVLDISFWFFLAISSLGLYFENPEFILVVATCLNVLLTVASFIMNVFMLESMFSSDRKCGESLWQYGIFKLVFLVVWVIGLCGKGIAK